MPLLFSQHPLPDTTFAVWQIAEPEEFFRKGLPLSETEAGELENLKGQRRVEWLACRWLLHRLSGERERLPLAKDAFSKPFFLGRPGRFCSLSHSHGLVGALIAGQNCGCDLQLQVSKMPRIAPRFMNEQDLALLEAHPLEAHLDLLHLFWTIKESLYKTYGLKALDFKAHMRVEPFNWEGAKCEAVGHVEKEDFSQAYQLLCGKYWLPTADEDQLGVPFYWTVCLEMLKC